MAEKKYSIKEPFQFSGGGWFGQVYDGDKPGREIDDIVFETLQPSKLMAYNTCLYWVIMATEAELGPNFKMKKEQDPK